MDNRSGTLRKGARAAGAVLLIFAAVWGVRAEWREVFGWRETCAGWSMQWGIPVCVAPIGSEVSRHREVSFRFEYRRGRLVRMQRVNAVGTLTGEGPTVKSASPAAPRARSVSQWVPSYDEHGAARWLDGLDQDGVLVRRWEYSRTEPRRWLCRFLQGNLRVGADGAELQGWTLDERGLVTEARHLNAYGAPRSPTDPDASGEFATRWTHDANGLKVSETRLGSNGKVQNGKRGHATERYERGELGDLSRVTRLDENGQASFGSSSHVLAFRLDAFGNRAEALSLDADGQPAAHRGGIVRKALRRDGRGLWVEEAYFGRIGLREDSSGVARTTRRYDERGHLAEEAYFGLDDGPTAHRLLGYARVAHRHDDRGHDVETVFYGTNGGLVAVHGSVARFTSRFDLRGNLLERSYYDTEGRPGAVCWDCPTRYRYDDQGRWVEAHFATGDRARSTARYDVRGDLVETEHWGANGKPVIHHSCARVTNRYDGNGSVVETACFGVDGAPALRGNCARETRRYDERGDMVEEACFGVDGAEVPFAGPPRDGQSGAGWERGRSRSTYRHDDFGRVIEERHFAPGGDPASFGECARMTYRYGERGYREEEDCLGPDGTLAWRGGCARKSLRHDARGNVVEEACLGPDGALSARSPIPRVTRTYDARGQMVEEAFFGPDDQPRPNTSGYARVTRKYDEGGNETETAWFGVDGEPIVSQGCARYTSSFDENGRLVEQACFGIDGRPALRGGCARRVHDRSGGEPPATTCYGVDGAVKPTDD